jgi:hypothetical protein
MNQADLDALKGIAKKQTEAAKRARETVEDKEFRQDFQRGQKKARLSGIGK